MNNANRCYVGLAIRGQLRLRAGGYGHCGYRECAGSLRQPRWPRRAGCSSVLPSGTHRGGECPAADARIPSPLGQPHWPLGPVHFANGSTCNAHGAHAHTGMCRNPLACCWLKPFAKPKQLGRIEQIRSCALPLSQSYVSRFCQSYSYN